MSAFSGQVFDDTISGTSGTWYTASKFNEGLGSGDMLAVVASITDVGGSSPALTVKVEHSADGRDWIEADTSILTGAIPSTGGVYHGTTPYWPTLLAFIRLKLTLTGTSPKCRVKLSAVSRNLY